MNPIHQKPKFDTIKRLNVYSKSIILKTFDQKPSKAQSLLKFNNTQNSYWKSELDTHQDEIENRRLINFDELGDQSLELFVFGVSIYILVTGVSFVPLSINDIFSLSSSPSSMAFSSSFTAFILLFSAVATGDFLLQLCCIRFRRLSFLWEVLGFIS